MYISLQKAISNFFHHSIDFTRDESVKYLEEAITLGAYDRSVLRTEMDNLVVEDELKISQFVVQSGLLLDNEKTTTKYAINYLKYCFWDVLYPEFKVTEDIRINIVIYSLAILKSYSNNDSWIELEELLIKLKQNPMFTDLELYNLYHFLGDAVGEFEMNVEGKLELMDGELYYYVKLK